MIQGFYRQYDIDYDVRGNGEAVHKADRYKLNIYFDPIKRGADISAQMTEIEMQRAALQDMLDNKLPLDDDNTVKRLYRWFNIEYDNGTRIISGFSLNHKNQTLETQYLALFQQNFVLLTSQAFLRFLQIRLSYGVWRN